MADTDGRGIREAFPGDQSKGQDTARACRLRSQMYKTSDWNDKQKTNRENIHAGGKEIAAREPRRTGYP